MPGDVNDDRQINAADAILVLQIAAGLVEPTESQRLAADMDGNGEIRANDAIIVLRKVVGLAAPPRDR